MIKPVEVERDKNGFWLHPALGALEDEQPISELPEAADMELAYLEFYSDAPPDILEKYENGGSPWSSDTWEDAVKAWQPTQPKGEGWFLLALYDTEDGPYACFARAALPSSE